MFKTHINVAVAAAIALFAGSALAANNTAIFTIEQADGPTWIENVSGLLVVDANNNFTMANGAQGGFFQNGQFVNSIDTGAHPDYWQWQTDAKTGAGYWNWQSSTDGNPMAELSLKNVSGHGDPDLSYAISAVNNSTSTQTYSFAVGEAIIPTVNSANIVHADIAGALTTRDANVTISPFGSNTAIQQFLLSSNNGDSFVNAGVNVGPTMSAAGTSTYGTFAANASGPIGSTWNYMEIVTKFTLTGKDNASLAGFASITPVPEPETYGMMLAGLALLAGMTRRRKV